MENEKTEQPSVAIKFVKIAPLLLSFTAVPPHSCTATVATPPLTLQRISLSTSSETVINAAKGASVKMKHCLIPSLHRPSSSCHPPRVPALPPTQGAEAWGGIFRSLPPCTGMQERLQFSAELVNASFH